MPSKGRNVPQKLSSNEQWIEKHSVPLWQTAYEGFKQHGRGALIVDCRGGKKLVPVYKAATDFVGDIPKHDATLIDSYDPDRDFICIFLGRIDMPDEVATYTHHWRRRDIAA